MTLLHTGGASAGAHGQEVRRSGVQVHLRLHEGSPSRRELPRHQTLEQKLAHARSLKKVLDVQRPILVDVVAGRGLELYGALPNMTYVIERGGKVLIRLDWTDLTTI